MARTTTSSDEVIIAVMGATGSGKSSFINLVAGTNFAVGPGLKSRTKGIEISPPFEFEGRRVTLVDTPGFDDTNLTDTEVLTLIALFLSQAYESNRLLNGVIFLHRISDFRVSGVTRRNFGLFRNLCGDENLKNVVIATNMWSQVDPDVGDARELELASEDIFFKPALLQGAQMVRHDRTLESAHAIIQALVENQRMELRIQRELVVEGKDITETAAGQELNQELVELNKKHRQQLTQVQQEMSAALVQKDLQSKRELDKVRSELLAQIKKNEDERVNLSSQYAREREEMTNQLASLRTSLQTEVEARKKGEEMLVATRQSQEQQAAEYTATRAQLDRQLEEMQHRAARSGRRRPGLIDFLVPAVALISRFI